MQCAIVTGSSGGIGKAIAARLVQDGRPVFGCSRHSPGHVTEVGDLSTFRELRADVSNESDVKHLFEEAEVVFGAPDVLVNNAGMISMAPLADMSLDQWSENLAVNLTGAFLTTREFARRCPGAGCIVNVGSISGARPTKHQSAYAVAKAGLMGLSRASVAELAPRIRVVHLSVGFVDTGFGGVRPSVSEFIRRATPMGQHTTPEDVADAVAFAVGAKSVAADAMIIDGGLLSRF